MNIQSEEFPYIGSALVAGAIAGAWVAFCAVKLAAWHKARRAERARAGRYTLPLPALGETGTAE